MRTPARRRGVGSMVLALGLLALALLAAPRAARADDDPKRKVVVLEYRAGSAAVPTLLTDITAQVQRVTSLAVLDLNGARQKFGARLDETVAECAGDAECLAGVGRKLEVAEVVLLGISELGDVILTLQRIDVAGRAVTTRVAESLAPDQTPSADQLAQYLARLLPASDFIRFGLLKVVARQAGAKVAIGGEPRGLTPIEPLRVRAPASYDILVEKQGFVPFRANVAVPADGEVAVNADLSPLGGAAPRWYTKWWVLTAAAVVVAGATGTAAWLLTRDPGNVPVSGTL
jgi:hypothetical protein